MTKKSAGPRWVCAGFTVPAFALMSADHEPVSSLTHNGLSELPPGVSIQSRASVSMSVANGFSLVIRRVHHDQPFSSTTGRMGPKLGGPMQRTVDLDNDSFEAMQRLATDLGWGDGLPLVAPTEARVEAMLG